MATIQMEHKSAVPDLMLSQTRVIRAPRERVYEAWTNPDILMQWFGSAGNHSPFAAMDLRIGGEYRIEFVQGPRTSIRQTSASSTNGAAVGQFLEIIPNELLQFTWSPSWHLEEKTVVTVAFKEVPEGTELTLVHENFLTETSRDNHSKGWNDCFTQLAALLEA